MLASLAAFILSSPITLSFYSPSALILKLIPYPAPPSALTAFRRRAARWPVLDFIARHVHTLRQGAPSYAFDTAFAATAEQVAEADVPMAQVCIRSSEYVQLLRNVYYLNGLP